MQMCPAVRAAPAEVLSWLAGASLEGTMVGWSAHASKLCVTASSASPVQKVNAYIPAVHSQNRALYLHATSAPGLGSPVHAILPPGRGLRL